MAHGTKYRTNFYDLEGNFYSVSLKQKDYTGSETVLHGTDDALVYEFPTIKKYAPTKGFGGVLEVFAQSNRQLLDLYSADYKEWIIEITKNSEIDFIGYLDPEVYEQTLKRPYNYPVSILFNNGLSVLEREKYVQSDGSKYRGLTNVFTVLKTALEKITVDLPFTSLKITSNLRINDSTGDSTHSVLQELVSNNDNFIDEDNESLNCKQVIQSILGPFGLSLYTHKDTIYVIFTDQLRLGSFFAYSYDIAADGTIATSSTGTELQEGFLKNLAILELKDNKFDTRGGYNFFVLRKSRYVKPIIDEVDFDNEENYDGDPNGNVWRFGDWETILNIPENYTGSYAYWRSRLAGDYWMTNSVGGSSLEFSNWNLNTEDELPLIAPNGWSIESGTNYRCYYSTNNSEVAFAGGRKSIKEVDGEELLYDEDGQDFKNYIIVNNPWYGTRECLALFDGPPSQGGGYSLPPYPYSNYESSVTFWAFKYSEESPYIFPSSKTVIRLQFKVNFMSPGIYRNVYHGGQDKWYVVKDPFSDYEDDYGLFALPVKIMIKNKDGVAVKYLDFVGSYSGKDVPGKTQRQYQWKDCDSEGNAGTTVIPVENINELGNQKQILNEDFAVNFDIPADFEQIGQLEVIFYNNIYKMEQDETEDLYHRDDVYKEDFAHIGFREISTTLIDKFTGEEIEIKDQELQYYVSEVYKTEKQEQEIIAYSADNRYITDLGGILKSDTYLNENLDYITSVYASGFGKSNLEDHLGQRYVSDYQNSKIILKPLIKNGDLYPIHSYRYSNDWYWNIERWATLEFIHHVCTNEVQLTLENYY